MVYSIASKAKVDQDMISHYLFTHKLQKNQTSWQMLLNWPAACMNISITANTNSSLSYTLSININLSKK